MKDVMEIAEIIKRRIERDYAEDISIFAYYGSQAMGTADEWSDLDFFFIPRTERGKSLMHQFIIDDIGYDLFPISWERLAKIIALDQPLTAVVTESIVLYSGSEEEEERYEHLREILKGHFTNGNQAYLLEKAKEYFKDAYAHFFNMENGTRSIENCQVEASKLVTKVVLTLAFINGEYFKTGLEKAIRSTYEYDKLPKDYQGLLESIITEVDVDVLIENCRSLIYEVKTLLNKETLGYGEKEPYNTLFVGYYEEIKSTFNKLIRACDAKDPYTVYFRTISVQEEISMFMAKAEQGVWFEGTDHYQWYKETFKKYFKMDLINHAVQRDYDALKKSIIEFDKSFKTFLEGEDLEIVEYSSIEDFNKNFGK